MLLTWCSLPSLHGGFQKISCGIFVNIFGLTEKTYIINNNSGIRAECNIIGSKILLVAWDKRCP